ncbi:MAG TPA: DUF4932 domain-containing protein [Puia sp.]|nr:DUF4932 domain-containing protein [Puia sp.]
MYRYCLCFVLLSAFFYTDAQKKILVRSNRNVELFGLMMDLDNGADLLARKDTMVIDNRRATWKEWYAAVVRNYVKYRSYDSCAVMGIYRKMARDGYSDDWFVDFLLQVDDAPNAKITRTMEGDKIRSFSKKGDSVEGRRNAGVFLAAFNAFYRAVHFDDYLRDNSHYYALARAEVTRNLPGNDFIPVMEKFYRQQFNTYCLAPSLTLPTSVGFGKTVKKTRTIYNVFAPFSFQRLDSVAPDLGFNYPDRIRMLTVHEFGHSFVNPAVDALPQELIRSTEYLYAPIKEEMVRHSYTSWTQCLYEHFVKAGEVIIAEKLGDTVRAGSLLSDFGKTGFIYVPAIVEVLRKYDKNASLSYKAAVLAAMQKLKRDRPEGAEGTKAGQ